MSRDYLFGIIFSFSFFIHTSACENSVLLVCSSSLNDYSHFMAIKKIEAILLKSMQKCAQELCRQGKKITIEDRRKDYSGGLNPYYYQTEHGFFLNFSYGKISKLWTPWGEFMLLDFIRNYDGLWEQVFEEMQKRLTVMLVAPQVHRFSGSYGPTYKITAIDGVPLPEPSLKERDVFWEMKDCWQAWKELEDQYAQEVRGKSLL